MQDEPSVLDKFTEISGDSWRSGSWLPDGMDSFP